MRKVVRNSTPTGKMEGVSLSPALFSAIMGKIVSEE
jgi:hypothetical protein